MIPSVEPLAAMNLLELLWMVLCTTRLSRSPSLVAGLYRALHMLQVCAPGVCSRCGRSIVSQECRHVKQCLANKRYCLRDGESNPGLPRDRRGY